MNLIFLRRLQHGFNFEIKETQIYILLFFNHFIFYEFTHGSSYPNGKTNNLKKLTFEILKKDLLNLKLKKHCKIQNWNKIHLFSCRTLIFELTPKILTSKKLSFLCRAVRSPLFSSICNKLVFLLKIE
jgi:hypothetical protein